MNHILQAALVMDSMLWCTSNSCPCWSWSVFHCKDPCLGLEQVSTGCHQELRSHKSGVLML